MLFVVVVVIMKMMMENITWLKGLYAMPNEARKGGADDADREGRSSGCMMMMHEEGGGGEIYMPLVAQYDSLSAWVKRASIAAMWDFIS